MSRAATASRRAAAALLAVALGAGCTPVPYEPQPLDLSFRPPVGSGLQPPAGADAAAPTPAAPQPPPGGPLQLQQVLDAVTSRYPPYLSALLERDLASGRLRSAMGGFDTNLTAKFGSQVEGYYDATTTSALLEQPLATGDSIYGGYRISDGLLPAYDKDRTQDSGELLLGGRLPLLRDRGFDRRRAGVRQAEIDVELADPTIARARIDFLRAAARSYYVWIAAGRRVQVQQDLLRLATERVADLGRAVERQFLAPIEVTANEQTIAQRRALLVRAERILQQAALELSLFLRDADDTPIVPGPDRLPPTFPEPAPIDPATLQADTELAIQQRPELRRLQLQIDRTETDRQLAQNQTLPNLDLVVEASRSLGNGPYSDREEHEIFVGGELKFPLRRREALGRVEQATAQLSRLRLEQQFARDRIVNEVADARSALQAAYDQLAATRQNVELARQLVAAEKRAFELGRSDMLRIQLVEVQLANAQVLEVDTLLDYYRAVADYRAALGHDALPTPKR